MLIRFVKPLLCVLALALVLSGCAKPERKLESELTYEEVHSTLKEEQDKLLELRKEERELEKAAPVPPLPLIQPMAPTYNPLDEIPVSISIQNESLADTLFSVAKVAGLNLVIEPGITMEDTMTISFENTPCSQVIETLLRAYDYGYEVQDNVLYVKRFDEKSFRLKFLNIKSEADIASGGDVQGSGSPFTGNFKISSTIGKGIEADSVYDFVSKSLDKFLGVSEGAEGENGFYNLDPVTGQLLVRTTPSRMKTVQTFVDDVTRTMARQVVLDTRILEVELNDGFQFGVDWNFVNARLSSLGSTLSLASAYQAGTGAIPLIFSSANSEVDNTTTTTTTTTITNTSETDTTDGTSSASAGGETDNESEVETSVEVTRTYEGDASTVEPTITALEEFGNVKTVSNPHIRARHGQPTLFMSGSTEKYISEITTTADDNGNLSYSTSQDDAFTGVMLGVVPFINEDASVDLFIFPVKNEVKAFSTQTIGENTLKLPTTTTHNISTNVRLRNGDTMILGGIISNKLGTNDAGLPYVSRVPYLGSLVKQQERSETVTELVIIMHVRVIEPIL